MKVRKLARIAAQLATIAAHLQMGADAGDKNIINGRPTTEANPGALRDMADSLWGHVAQIIEMLPEDWDDDEASG